MFFTTYPWPWKELHQFDLAQPGNPELITSWSNLISGHPGSVERSAVVGALEHTRACRNYSSSRPAHTLNRESLSRCWDPISLQESVSEDPKFLSNLYCWDVIFPQVAPWRNQMRSSNDRTLRKCCFCGVEVIATKFQQASTNCNTCMCLKFHRVFNFSKQNKMIHDHCEMLRTLTI